jgi:hypothetical protein
MDKYIVIVSNVNVRKVMSTLNNFPVGRLTNGQEIDVFQTESPTLSPYTWGRITDTPDENGQYRWVALSRPGKTFCEKVPGPAPVSSDVIERIEALERRVKALEGG